MESSIISIDNNTIDTSSRTSLMYSSESVRPKIESCGPPALTGYPCEDFPSRTTWSALLLRKDEIRHISIWPEVP